MIEPPIDGDDPPELPTPINLSGNETESGIRLSWSFPSGSYIYFTGYYIYRKSTVNNSYQKIATVSGSFNRSYDDIDVFPGASYSYYVSSFEIMPDGMTRISLPSSTLIIKAPLRPRPVLSFDAIQNSISEIELRWENDNSQFIQETIINKHIIGVTNDFQPLKSFTADQHHYMDHDLIPGKKVEYQISHVTSLGISNAKYDFVQIPYRDISQPSPVYIKQIRYTDDRIERWPAGKPEFVITVNNVDANKAAYAVQDEMIFIYADNDSKTSQTFYGRKVLDWRPGFWYDMLTFTVVEYDVSWGTMEVTASVGYNEKNAEKKGLTIGGSIDYKYTIQDEGEKCGSSWLSYFDQPNDLLEFPNYGVQVRVGDSDSN